jgi:hypothetical protein
MSASTSMTDKCASNSVSAELTGTGIGAGSEVCGAGGCGGGGGEAGF